MSADTPRQLALSVLNDLTRGRANLDQLLNMRFASPSADMSRRDRALAYAIIYGVLRWRTRLDWHISVFATRPINQIKPEILNILRIGLFQMLFLSKIPHSAAVNTSVEMAKKSAPPQVVRFVNGLLRNAARRPDAVNWPDPEKDPIQALAVDESFPQWLIRRWQNRYGIEETQQLCRYFNEIPPVTVRANSLKTTREKLIKALAGTGDDPEPTKWAGHGIALPGLHGPIPDLPGFEEGWFQVQDEAAQLATRVLAPEPGENILDACAGLGGKTGHIAQCMDNRGKIVAMDSDNQKLEDLLSAMQRLGVHIAQTRCHDLEAALDRTDAGRFDRVLVDAPCSGLGVIRRNPDIKWAAEKRDFPRYQQKQIRLLTNAAQGLAPGGILVYAVCSMEPEETDTVISEFCDAADHFEVEPAGSVLPELADLADPKGFLRLLPHRHHTDGFFIARLRRRR
ncbi:MAG: 16S rRNA (cytosine(967)-C(5))-methyltransferase RsmB [Desulfobacterales bacterium]|nr:16S rRNA (cytosine(967)-C(5))-methyltransferase RsmB [Desulfobacterales bacterium]